MLIVPLSGKITWRNPPWVTIGLILINCFVFLVFQTNEDTRYKEAMSFYFESDLAQMEISRYLAYLENRTGDKRITALRNQQKLDQETLYQFYRRMQRDRDFVHRLYRGEIIPPYDDLHETWKQLRKEYEERLSKVTSQHYGFIPARMSAVNAFTHMFLHGGFMHLLGNMIFLWLVGCVLEAGWGRVLYGATYVVTGLLAVGLYALVNMESHIPLVGASGAISGLIGAYTVSYGRNRIKVFYSLGFYFDYVRVRAILLLPAWIAMELFQFFFGSESGVAYMVSPPTRNGPTQR
jgi:membrane associated rhomboid family serine protease